MIDPATLFDTSNFIADWNDVGFGFPSSAAAWVEVVGTSTVSVSCGVWDIVVGGGCEYCCEEDVVEPWV
jgi:hypothetical protein